MTQIHLLGTRRFAPFFWTQFLGAFNDNLYKNALVVMLTFHTASWTTLTPETLTNLAAGLFILPFFVFSATAGQLADKYDKAWLARLVKLLEIVIIGIAAFGFYLHSLSVLLAALFLLGLQSALFGPVKYAILPQHLAEEELVGGNALVESGTFVSILVGTLAGGLLAGSGLSAGWIAFAGFLVAVGGYAASCGIPAAPAPSPDLRLNLNPLTETWHSMVFARENRTVFLAIVGISWFWLYGALLLAQFPVFARNVLGGNEALVTLMLSIFTVGIAAGSMLCEKFSGRHVEIGLVPFGAIGLTLFGADLALASPTTLSPDAPLPLVALLATGTCWRILFDLFAIGAFGGLFVVPLYVLMQSRSAAEHRARIIAANNILNALFMVIGAVAAGGLLWLGVSIPVLFGIAAAFNALVAVFVFRQVPEHFIRFLASLVVHAIYRLDKRGLDAIPESGPAVLICNHVSFVDPVILMAAVRRPICFVMDYRIYAAPGLNFVFRNVNAIPIAPAKDDADIKEAAFTQAAAALRNGELIGLFPEGKITRDGELNVFRYGVQRMVEETPVPVIPMALRGLWGSFFSRRYGPAMRVPSCIHPFRRITLVVGDPVPPEAVDPDDLRTRVSALRGGMV